jgi:hypothetical protein
MVFDSDKNVIIYERCLNTILEIDKFKLKIIGFYKLLEEVSVTLCGSINITPRNAN